MAAPNIIKGDDLMLFDAQGKSIGYATAHTLTLSGETVDISSKDHGIWGASEVNYITWEITSENIYTDEAYESLFDIMMAREPITVSFGHKVDEGTRTVVDDYDDETAPLTHWSPDDAKGVYQGRAYLTSLVANANSGENATFSVTLTGAGKIVKTAA